MSRKRNGMIGLLVVALVAAGFWVYRSRPRGVSEEAQPGSAPSPEEKSFPVVLTQARALRFEDRITVAGTAMSKRFAEVTARIPGTLDAIDVDEGDRVEAGKTRLFQTDRVKVARAVEIASQEVAVAECAISVNRASRESLQADFDKAKIDYERFQRLYDYDRAVTQDALELQRSRFLQLEAQLKLAGVRIELAEKQFEQAKSNLAIAEKDLRDSEVFAPIDGIVSARYIEPGEAAGKDHPVLKIVDPSVLEVSIFIPEQYYDRVLPGQTPMRIAAEGVQLENREIVYKSPTVQADLRTFEVKCLIENPPSALVAGRMVQTETILAAHEGVGVPVDAIKQMRTGPVVFTVKGGRAGMIPVKTGLQTDGWIEVLDAGLTAGTPIVSVGQDFLDDGFAVSVVKES